MKVYAIIRTVSDTSSYAESSIIIGICRCNKSVMRNIITEDLQFLKNKYHSIEPKGDLDSMMKPLSFFTDHPTEYVATCKNNICDYDELKYSFEEFDLIE